MRTIQSSAELYAHAIAIEREAAERYTEFSWRMEDAGNEAAAEVFGRLARFESEHLQSLLKETKDLELPAIESGQYRWLDSGAPETGARELVFRLMSPRNALTIALGAERRAEAFFEHVVMTAADPALRALARDMAADEGEHISIIGDLLERTPEPRPGYLPEDQKGDSLV